MKQMIACEQCAKRAIPQYEGEYWFRVHGTAKENMLCDWCCPPTEIKKGDRCAADTLGLIGRGIPYSPWEGGYIILDGKEDHHVKL
jgi:hypothetical protein